MVNKCKAASCGVTSPSKIKTSGYCTKHEKLAPVPAAVTPVPTAGDYALLMSRVAALETESVATKAENAAMKFALKEALEVIDTMRGEMNSIRGSINTSNYQRDELEQYGRRESGRLRDVVEDPIIYDNKGKIKDAEDCAQVIVDAAAVAGVKIEKADIQRAHRVGRRKLPGVNKQGVYQTPKPRPIIFKMKDYGKRLAIIKNKKKFRENTSKDGHEKLKEAFIVEDLTPLRSKLLWYAKNRCHGKFINCHTKEGKILAQTSESLPGEWISLSSPEDFHRHGIDLDIKVINDGLRKIQVLEDVHFKPLSKLLQ